MAQTVLSETRSVLTVDGEQIFRMAITCISAGELPDTGLFVLEIVDDLDPQQDVFARIAEITDIESDDAYENDRNAAVAAGSSYWRSHYFEKDYDDLEVAVAAVQAVFDRVNTLVSDFDTYKTSFRTLTPDVLYFPSSTDTEIEALKTAYNNAYTAYEAAVTAEATALSNLQQSQTTLLSTTEAYNEWSYWHAKMVTRAAEMLAAYDALVDLNGDAKDLSDAVNTFIVAYDAGGSGVPTARDDLYDANQLFLSDGYIPAMTDILLADAGVTNHDAMVSEAETMASEKSALMVSAQGDVTDKQTSYNQAQGNTATAYTTLETAYNAVKAVCPNWSPTNPFPPMP
jgi:hypothetical protein